MLLEQRFSNLSGHQSPLGHLVHHGLPDPAALGVSDSAGLGWGQRVCISSEFPGNAVARGHILRPTGPCFVQGLCSEVDVGTGRVHG